MMFQILFRHVNECKELLNTEYLVDDMCKLVRTSTGKIEAGKGEHDDCVMSYNIGMYLFYTGDNLELFGINNKIHPVLGAIETDDALQEIDTMKDFFSIENVTFEDIVMKDAARLEQESRYLVDHLSFMHDDVYSNPKNRQTSLNDEVDIDPYFFDSINK